MARRVEDRLGRLIAPSVRAVVVSIAAVWPIGGGHAQDFIALPISPAFPTDAAECRSLHEEYMAAWRSLQLQVTEAMHAYLRSSGPEHASLGAQYWALDRQATELFNRGTQATQQCYRQVDANRRAVREEEERRRAEAQQYEGYEEQLGSYPAVQEIPLDTASRWGSRVGREAMKSFGQSTVGKGPSTTIGTLTAGLKLYRSLPAIVDSGSMGQIEALSDFGVMGARGTGRLNVFSGFMVENSLKSIINIQKAALGDLDSAFASFDAATGYGGSGISSLLQQQTASLRPTLGPTGQTDFYAWLAESQREFNQNLAEIRAEGEARLALDRQIREELRQAELERSERWRQHREQEEREADARANYEFAAQMEAERQRMAAEHEARRRELARQEQLAEERREERRRERNREMWTGLAVGFAQTLNSMSSAYGGGSYGGAGYSSSYNSCGPGPGNATDCAP